MQSRGAQSILRAAVERGADRASGLPRARVKFSSSRVAAITLMDSSKLPAALNTQPLQNSSGQFLFLAGYSQIGGGDVLG